MLQLTNSPTPELDLRLLRAHAQGDEGRLVEYVTRRNAGEPVAQIVGTKGFWTGEFVVSRDVLTPRPDTETILDTLLRLRPAKDAALRVLDLGTGSGCIILSVLSEYPNAKGDAVDVSEKALAVARGNAMIDDRVSFYHGAWCAPLPEGAVYDVIVSNPPYIPTAEIAVLAPDVREFEPMLALDGGEDGLDCYRILATEMKTRMVSSSLVLLEVGANQADAVASLMCESGYRLVEIAKDLSGIPRVVVLAV